MGEGLKGQLAPVKYLFEATGLYPATEISETKPDKESLAHTLMRNLKLPESPIVNEDDNEDDEDADSSNSSPAAAGAGQTNQPSGADEKCSQGEEGTTAERAGDSVVE
jgi:hypothetical protein